MQHLGQAIVAITTTIITLYTFAVTWVDDAEMKATGVEALVYRFSWILVGVPWLFLVVLITVSASIAKARKRSPFYFPTPYTCWINSDYPNHRIAGENFWLWIAFAVSVLYIPLFFWSRGYISPVRGAWWRFRINSAGERETRCTSRSVSTSIIICGLAYCVPVLPTSLSRWFLLAHGDPKPFAGSDAQFTTKAIFSLSGICDAVVFLLTRQEVLFKRPLPSSSSISLNDMNTAGTGNDQNEVDIQYIPSGVPMSILTNIPSRNLPAGDALNDHKSNLVHIGFFVFFWLSANGAQVAWICFYIKAATKPNPHSAVNDTPAKWQGYYVMHM